MTSNDNTSFKDTESRTTELNTELITNLGLLNKENEELFEKISQLSKENEELSKQLQSYTSKGKIQQDAGKKKKKIPRNKVPRKKNLRNKVPRKKNLKKKVLRKKVIKENRNQ